MHLRTLQNTYVPACEQILCFPHEFPLTAAKNVPVFSINYKFLIKFFLNIFFEYISQDYSYKVCKYLLKRYFLNVPHIYLTLNVELLDQTEKLIIIFMFTLLCGTCKRFYEVFMPFIKPFRGTKRVLTSRSYVNLSRQNILKHSGHNH